MLRFFILHDQKSSTFLLNYSNDQKLVCKWKSYILVTPPPWLQRLQVHALNGTG